MMEGSGGGGEGVCPGSGLRVHSILPMSTTNLGAIHSYLFDSGDDVTGFALGTKMDTILEKREKAINHRLHEEVHAFVKRSCLTVDLNNIYRSNPTLLKHKLSFTYLDEPGVDINGITRDVFASYWDKSKEAFERHPCRKSFVPVQCDNRCDLFSSILAHSFLLTGQMPYYLPELVVVGITCSIDEVKSSPYLLEKCVQLFIELHCKDVQDKLNAGCIYGVSDDDETMEEMKLLFHTYDMLLDPAANFKSSLEQLVLKCLFIQPPCFVQMCAVKLKEMLGPMTASNTLEILDSLEPTGRKIIGCLYPQMSQVSLRKTFECVVYNYLLIFLRKHNYNRKIMRQFLKFVTGSSGLTEPKIYVQFHRDFPFPRANTCSCTLYLPAAVYKSYDEFENMLLGLLSNEYSQIFSDV